MPSQDEQKNDTEFDGVNYGVSEVGYADRLRNLYTMSQTELETHELESVVKSFDVRETRANFIDLFNAGRASAIARNIKAMWVESTDRSQTPEWGFTSSDSADEIRRIKCVGIRDDVGGAQLQGPVFHKEGSPNNLCAYISFDVLSHFDLTLLPDGAYRIDVKFTYALLGQLNWDTWNRPSRVAIEINKEPDSTGGYGHTYIDKQFTGPIERWVTGTISASQVFSPRRYYLPLRVTCYTFTGQYAQFLQMSGTIVRT